MNGFPYVLPLNGIGRTRTARLLAASVVGGGMLPFGTVRSAATVCGRTARRRARVGLRVQFSRQAAAIQ